VSGTHTLSIEDALTHKFTSSPIQVTGMGDLLRPAHFRLSAASLDLGAGDQATNSVRKVALTNLGGGQISWQANANQPWLSISPKSGTFSSGMRTEVEIAVDRTNLRPGSFSDQVLFSSSAGDSALPIKMSVLALPQQNNPVLQLSPAILSFTGSDGGSPPAVQEVNISNPGQGTLHWTAGTNIPWLVISSQSGTVNASASQQAAVSVDTSNLLPGTYSGTITFKGDGAGEVMHNLQSVAVSVTVTPRCALAVASDALSFTAAYQQSVPDAKVVHLSTANCSSSIVWKATSHASWLTVSQTNGSTPAGPAIGINAAGLKSGAYTSSVTFSSDSGTQEVPVSFTLSQPAEPVLSVASTGGLSFSGMAGQGDTATQNIPLTNTGSAPLLWSAKTTTGSSGNWLSLRSSSGSLSAHQSASLTVVSKTLTSMAPGTYSGVITITATDQQGNVTSGSPQKIRVSKVVSASCTVAVSPSALNFSGSVGQAPPANQSFTITVGSGCVNALSWTTSTTGGDWLATMAASGSSSANKPGAVGVRVATDGLAPGRYSGSITITTIDSVTHAAIGNPQIIVVTLNVATLSVTPTPTPALPSIQVSDTTLAFSTSAGTNPAPQTVKIINTGHDRISWQAGTPSQPWLSVSPNSGVAGASSTITLSANVAGLTPGRYNAQVVLKPSSGSPIIVKASLKISGVAPTPAITPDPTPVPPTVVPQSGPTPVAVPTPNPTPTPLPNPPTPTAVSSGAPPPVQTAIPSPNPTPVPTSVPTPIQPTPGQNTQNPVPTSKPISTHTNTTNSHHPGHVKATPSPAPPPKTVPVIIPTVVPQPTRVSVQPTPVVVLKACVTATPTYLYFTTQDGDPESQTVTLNNCGNAGTITLRSSNEWVTATGGGPVQAGASTTITVHAVHINQAGTYSGAITVLITTSNGRSTSVAIGVTLKVQGSQLAPQPTQPPVEQLTPTQTSVEQPDPTQPSRRKARPTALPNAQ
ncbi:MAG: choice-of-anchor D domain-containing protein, partial [Ktedonobacteraceae bacterium]|nr:choice-of-anchor D domain-containing protein [Ktedonobacteraceae bacterium]